MSDKKYNLLDRLDESNVLNLIELSKNVGYSYSTGSNRRVGAGKHEQLSRYWYSKWFKWSELQREIYSNSHYEFAVSKSIQSWFLKFDAETGFLDEMNTWVGDPGPSTIVAVALYDGQKIKLGEDTITLNRGEAVQFTLDVIHSVPETPTEQLWAYVS